MLQSRNVNSRGDVRNCHQWSYYSACQSILMKLAAKKKLCTQLEYCGSGVAVIIPRSKRDSKLMSFKRSARYLRGTT